MSLSQQLASQMPFLRRFASALSGSPTEGDRFVRATLEQIVNEPERFPRAVEPRLGLYRLFLDLWREHGRQQPAAGSADQQRVADARLAPMRQSMREALLLTTVEGFTAKEASWLLDVTAAEIDALVADAVGELQEQTRTRVMIIEDEPLIAMDIEGIVRGLGHDITGVATTRAEALALALEDRPGLVLADIELADESSGVDAVNEILSHFEVPVIFITAFPERLLAGDRPKPTFLVTKPFQRSTLQTTISQALFFNQETIPDRRPEELKPLSVDPEVNSPPDPPPPSVKTIRQLRALDAADLAPLPAPINAAVIGGRLRVVSSFPVETRLSPDRIATLWQLHAATAERIATELDGSNAGRAFTARVQAVRHALATSPNDNDALAIGVQSHGLAGMLPTVRDVLMNDMAADIEAFLADLRQLAKHFASYREFVGDAEQTPALPPEQEAALSATARLLETAPDEAVDPALKEGIADVRSNAEEVPDPVTRLALLRTIGNVLKGLARHLRDLSKRSGKKFAEELGGELGRLTVKLMKGGTLLVLANFAPAGLDWVLGLLAAAELISRSGNDKEKSD